MRIISMPLSRMPIFPGGATAERVCFICCSAPFIAAGVEPPSADLAKRWTWEQIVEAGRKIARPADSLRGFSFEQQERPFQILPPGQSLGGAALSPDGFKATGFIDGPAFVEGFTFMQKLYTEAKISPPGQFGTALTPELFGSGKCAMLPGGTFIDDTLKSKFPNHDFGVASHLAFARIAADDPVPMFPNVDRTLAVPAGDGVQLVTEGPGTHRIEPECQLLRQIRI